MAYIAKGRYYTYGVRPTLANVAAITGAAAGETVFCQENFRKLTYDGDRWMCSDFIKLINGTGSTVNPGTVLVASATADTAVLSTSLDNPKVYGPAVFTSAAGSSVVIAIFGIYQVNTNSSTSHGDFAFTNSSGGTATSTTTMGDGCFGIYVENKAAAGLTKCMLRAHYEYF